MVLTDQQLRQELTNLGETVPPITQRNREQLRARLEALKSHTNTRSAKSPSRAHAAASPSRTRATASPSRSHVTSSPSKTRAAASPSRTHVTASPSKTRATKSPTRTRAAASPSRSSLTSSPSRTRANATTSSLASRSGTRSKQTPNLIELSDSETDSASAGVLKSRSVRAGKTSPDIQKRSIAVRRQHGSPTSGSGGPGTMIDDVEQSITRHRREIKQLLDSARERNRATNTSITSLHSGKHDERKKTPSRSRSPSPSVKSRTRRQSSKSDTDDHSEHKTKRSGKTTTALKRIGKPIQSFWKKYLNLIKNIFKLLFVGSILLSGTLFLMQNYSNFFPHQEEIRCSVKNVSTCEDMAPVIAAVRKQLQVRTGEVECGFRQKESVIIDRAEIERNLNEKGLKFTLGNEERWKALITYIIGKPLNDIIVWNAANHQTKNINDARKLSTKDAIRSLTCRARQDISKTLRNILLLILGSTGLLSLAWVLQRKSKAHEENEETFKSYLERATDLIREQYEKHIKDPQAQPWLAISHIRDKLIPEEDQERLKHIWERVKNEISKQDSRIRSELQEINGKKDDVWRWIKSAAASSSPRKTRSQSSKDLPDESDPHTSPEVGLTECLKLRNCFRSDNSADDEEIDHVVDSVQHRCANIKRIEHIGINSVYVYIKFSSKQAAAQGFHLLNNWHYQNREINVKYLRPERYYEHFPEAQDAH